MKKKRYSVIVPLRDKGRIEDVFLNMYNILKNVTNNDVDILCDIDGKITIYFGDEARPENKKNYDYDIEKFLNLDEMTFRNEEQKLGNNDGLKTEEL